MDVGSLVIGIPGLVQSCVHGYRFVVEMLALDNNIAVLRLRYRIEQCNFQLWARFWGLLDDGESNGDNGRSGSPNLRGPDDRFIDRTKKDTMDFDDLLGVPGLESLIQDILNQTKDLLDQIWTISNRYEIDPDGSGAKMDGLNKQPPSTSKTLLKKLTTRSRLRWAITDKSSFENILTSLRSLNDGLDRLLPRPERINLRHALVGEVLADEGIAPIDNQAQTLFLALGTAKENERFSVSSDHKSLQSKNDVSSQHNTQSDDLFGEQRSMELPRGWFQDLIGKKVGPKPLLYRSESGVKQAAQEERTIESIRIPGNEAAGEPSSRQRRDLLEGERIVFVEWRSYEETMREEQLQMALEGRREQICRLFQREAGEDDRDHYVLPCLGYVLLDMTMGLVFSIPEGSSGQFQTLNEVLEASYKSDNAAAADLDVRFGLAKKLSLALYQLQCAGWLHRRVSSHNIIFFQTAKKPGVKGSLDLTRPYLAGWQTSRQDDQKAIPQSEGMSKDSRNPSFRREYGYIHPSRPHSRFKRSHDIYSLGVVLAEIAFWEPIGALEGIFSDNLNMWDEKLHDLPAWSQQVVETCEKEIGAECGRRYKTAVMWCLRDVHLSQLQKWASTNATEQDAEREVGLEKTFFWKVVNGLDHVAKIVGV